MRVAFKKAKAGVDGNGVNMISFAKWVQFHACMKNVLRYEPPDISGYRQSKAGALAYLKSELSAISSGPITDQNLEDRSIELLRQEGGIRQRGDRSQRLIQITGV
jgi:hypothetical protein